MDKVCGRMKDMCARLLACPLCSQPGFLTLDALRAGLISVATRPLICPVCNEVLLGIDKLTIHLFSHTISVNGVNLNNNIVQVKQLNAANGNNTLVSVQDVGFQEWNLNKSHTLNKNNGLSNENLNQASQNPAKNFPTKEKTVPSLEVPTQDQNLTLKNTSQILFVSTHPCENGRTNSYQETCESRTITTCGNGTMNVNCTNQYYQNENNKHARVQENYHPEEPSIQTLKEWIQEQHCQSPVNSSKSNHSGRDLNQIESSSNAQTFEAFPKAIDPLDSHNQENEKQTKNKISSNKDEKSEGTNLTVKEGTDLEKTERCNICGFHFPDYNILLLHKQLVHMVEEKDLNVIPEACLKNYSCHLCSKVFKMRGSLMVHMRVAHIGYNIGALHKDGQVKVISNENGYNCPTCGKKFKKEQHVIQHLKTHEAKQWECEVCSKMFTTKYFLKKHKRLHSGEMPYKCNICSKTFTFQQSYHKHRLYHKDDKPHTCATCGRSFKELSTLHNHERIHTGEKPFACETCGKCFRQRVSYLVHRRIHTGVMPYKCTLCGKSFRYKVSQRTHKCPAKQSNEADQKQTVPEPKTTPITNNEQQINSTEDQPILQVVEDEKNKYILIINNQGQHVLTRESDAQSIQQSENKLQSLESRNITDENKELNNQWVTNTPNNIVFTKPVDTSPKVQLEPKKQNEENDFFSIVMAPLENEISSPTSEMEHLRVSSPTKKEEISASYVGNINERFNNEQSTNSLETINEESLKQLLYGINDK